MPSKKTLLSAAAGLTLLSAASLPLQAEDPAPAIVAPVASVPTVPAVHPLPAEPLAPAPKESPVSITSIYVSEPYVAITFDDGPHPRNTPKLLEMLAQRNIKATFFVIGEVAAEHPEILAQVAAAGHEIGNHSWSHPNLAKMSAEAVHEQLRKTDDVIRQVTGKRPTLMRPPYGSFTDAQCRTARDEFGYTVVLWSVDPYDWKKPGSSVVARRIVSATGKGSIILSHDIHAGTIAAMPSTLDQLLAKGYKFVTVSELMRHEAEKPIPKALAVESGKTTARQ